MINCKPFRRNRHGCCSFILLPKASRRRDVTAHDPPRRVISDGQPVQRSILEHGGVDLHAPAKSTKCESGSLNDEARITKSEIMARLQTRNASGPQILSFAVWSFHGASSLAMPFLDQFLTRN